MSQISSESLDTAPLSWGPLLICLAVVGVVAVAMPQSPPSNLELGLGQSVTLTDSGGTFTPLGAGEVWGGSNA